MASAAPTRPAISEFDRNAVAASVGDAVIRLKQAQRALARARRVASALESTEDEAAQEYAGRILELCRHVDSAVALGEGE